MTEMPQTQQTAHSQPTGSTHEIHWQAWSPEVFEQACKADKLILLDSGATWCHWCHVMDRVTYEDPEVVTLLNERFVIVQIDRDRLPAVDAHFQRAVPIINSRGNGWPLTVIITPEGYVLYKATFLPPRPDAKYGTGTGLIELLNQLDRYWRENREKINALGLEVRDKIGTQLREAYVQPGQLSDALVNTVLVGLQRTFDEKRGGFGGAPKFFAVSATQLLVTRGWGGDHKALAMALQTLRAQATGGVYDHVGGGFHRYSVDERWHVPHFEKMAYDNAGLLALYADAAALTGDNTLAATVDGTLEWLAREMTAPEGKGFYASQDADVGLDDDGDYFTWTVAEIRKAAGKHAQIAIDWYGVDTGEDMHNRKGRNVLHVAHSIEQFAKDQNRPAGAIEADLAKARKSLLAAREKRTHPSIDKTVFSDLNGMMIDAHLTAARRLGRNKPRQAALTSLDHLLATQRDSRGVFAHYRKGDTLVRIGLLDDQAWMLRALLNAYTTTSDARYLQAARAAADYILSDLTADDGGFVNQPAAATTGPAAIEPARYWEDSPTRSGASVAAQALADLGYLTNHDAYTQAAVKALSSFAGAVDPRYGSFLAGYSLAVQRVLDGPYTIVVVGPRGDPTTDELLSDAGKIYLPGGIVLSLDATDTQDAAVLEPLGYKAGDTPVAYVCRGKTCLAPATTPDELAQRAQELRTQMTP